MIAEATKEGYYKYRYTEKAIQKKIPKIQFLKSEDLIKEPLPINIPPNKYIMPSYEKLLFKKSPKQTQLFY